MDLSHATSQNLIFLNQNFTTKQAIFDFIAQKMADEGIVSSSEDYKKALYDRESMGVTGFENGLAIPHGKSSTVKKAAFAVVRLSQPLTAGEYVSLNSGNRVDTLFVLAIPESEAGSTHLGLLAELSARLGDSSYLAKIKSAKTSEELLGYLSEERAEAPALTGKKKGLILAVTACAAGVAHTYMAAEAITKKANALGYEAKVEKQGANGLEDAVTAADVAQAVGVILAHDVALKNTERFAKLPTIDVPVGAPIKNADKVVGDLLRKAEGFELSADVINVIASENTEEKEKNYGSRLVEAGKTHLMTGVSFMLPFVVAGGMILSIGLILERYWATNTFTSTMVSASVLIFHSMYPILAAYIAYSIADKPALVVGFSGGLIAFTVNSGYLGALLSGFIAGWLVKYMKKIPLPKVLAPLMPLIFIPLIGSGLIVLFIYTIGQPVTWLNEAMTHGLESMQGGSLVILGLIIGAMMAVDMGGPINKAAFAFCVGLIAQHIYAPMAACWIGIMTPPVALAVATMIAPKKFTKSERSSRATALIGGLTGITEFAIPFAVADPIRVISSLVVGSAVGGGLALALGSYAPVPSGGIFVVWTFHNPLGFLFAFLVGILVTAFMLIALKKPIAED